MKPKSRTKDIVIQELDSEVLVYDLSSKRALCLNRASALVWAACDGERTVSDITKVVSQRLESPINEDFVRLALDRLSRENLLINVDADALARNGKGVSRREVLKSLGSSMVALPMITAVTAPASAHAVSCGAPCQCSGLLANVAVCPPGFADCPQGCDSCVVIPNGCHQGEGTIFCDGICTSVQTCPALTDCQCIGLGNVASCSAALGGCPGTCTTCQVNAPCFLPGGEGALVCPGVCA
jgi:hypothetical protein